MKSCSTCLHRDVVSTEEPCRSCSFVPGGDWTTRCAPGGPDHRETTIIPSAPMITCPEDGSHCEFACGTVGSQFPRLCRTKDAQVPGIGHNGGPPLHPVFDYAEPNDPVVNPKDLAGSKKPSIWSVMPRWIVLAVGRVMSVGAAKYGRFNYRESRISASVYEDAIERHAQLWFDGEDNDAETGVSHLASIIASCSLLMDAQATGKLNDDRQKTGLVRKHLDDLQDLLVTLPLPKKAA